MDEPMAQVRALYEEHGGALLRYLRRLTGRGELAEELLQETFVQAMRGLDRLREARSPRAWLFSIARHLGLNALRRPRVMAPLSDGMAATPAHEEDSRRAWVRRAIGELPDPQREALSLRLAQGLSYEEIAEVLGVPVGTVRSRLHNAVRTLRDRVKQGEEVT
jgi:RNA polymerase sigma-70 factor (ECF subfamily)